MNTEINHAATFYSAIENDTEVLEKNVSDYPSSSLTRFLLLYHYKKNNDPRFEKFAQQSAVYLYNPLWIQFHLSTADENGNIYANKNSQVIPGNDITNSLENHDASTGAISQPRESPLPVNESLSPIANLHQAIENADLPSVIENSKTEIENADNSLDKRDPEDLRGSQEEPKENNFNNDELIDPGKEPVLPGAREVPLQAIEPNYETFTLGSDSDSQKNEEVLKTENNTTNSSEAADLLNVPTRSLNNNDQYVSEHLNETNVIVNKENEQQEAENLQNNLTEDLPTTDNENDDTEIEFEPLHTVDYFASQGIKIPQEAFENDKIGKQVKSFTAWLKSMKKLHPGQLPEQNEVIERIIQASSEVSNQNAHVLTEAMAEVLVKQGKKEKAIEMYEKLSLLNPPKSAYFAAKIESLKTI